MTPLYRLFSIEGREDDNSGTYQELKNKNSDAIWYFNFKKSKPLLWITWLNYT